MHDDIEGKANALTDTDYDNTFATIQDLGLNFLRLAHYPHPKETYDRCDQLGIVVQTEGPCVNKLQSTMPSDYYTHLTGQYTDMVNQHYNHPCIFFWGLSNETTTDDKEFAKGKIEGYKALIKNLDPERWVGYVLAQGPGLDPSGYYNNPDMDWFGCNIYVGWYASQNSNDPSYELNRRIANTITALGKPFAYSEYGCGSTQSCHSDDYMATTTRGNKPRHDIEYQMWLHEGHIAAIKNKPELLFTSQWQLFDIAVSSRNEGYTVCPDGVNDYIDDNLRRLNNKGLVERDHITKKDTYYLYKAWWNQTDKFVHICGKDFEKLTNRVIKCYTNDGNTLSLYVNDTFTETVTVTNNIAIFTATNFNPGDVIRVDGATTNDTFTFTDYSEENVFITNGNWNKVSNWSGNAVPTAVSNVRIEANATIPANYIARVGEISINDGATLTIADGGQLKHSNAGVVATVQKHINPYNDESGSSGYYLLTNPVTTDLEPATLGMTANNYDLYWFNQSEELEWRNYKQETFDLTNGIGYLYANGNSTDINFNGVLNRATANVSVPLADYDENASFAGFNLVGNPFVCNAYLADGRDFYVLDNNGAEVVLSETNSIAPMQGVFVQAAADESELAFSTTEPTPGRVLNMRLTRNDGNRGASIIDNARIHFGEGHNMEKFQINPNHTKFYIPKDGKEYAVVNANKADELPLNFKAEENGTFTLDFSSEEVEFGYLHLIDNMTGADVNLLQTPSYTFEAKTSDHASRFRLVFSTDD
jgi:beta-galactosidase